MNELEMPPAPALPADVQERVLQRVLHGMDAAPARAPRRRTSFLAAAAAVVVAIAATTVTAVSGFGADDPAGLDRLPPATVTDGGPGTATGEDPGGDPFAGVELPLPSGEPATDLALARCAAAVVHSGRAGEYPPTREWRSTLHMGVGAVESDLEINDSFACLVSPGSVAVSGLTGTPAGEVQVVRMSAGELVVLNPDGREFAIGLPGKMQISEDRVTFVDIYSGETPDRMRLAVTGGYDGPVPEPVQALVVTDRDLPERPDSPEGRYLDECFDRLPTHQHVNDRLWIPVGWHDVGGAAPPALVARIGNLAAGFCMTDPVYSRAFAEGPLHPDRLSGLASPVVFHRGEGSAILMAVAPDVTRVEIAAVAQEPMPRSAAPPQHDPVAEAGCTILDGFAMCTIDSRQQEKSPQARVQVVVTAYTADSPAGVEVYRN
ncbi:hypothetical protein GCM10010464_49600 [Pseudonocardia yunnanensis]|uniref:Uncharacterized protein n=1 Tax=Pseudonocardia yunnanensis TaxID=58107 RepID=A0ABW4EQ64_9PSEU